MNKSNKYALNGAIIGGLINALLNAIRQINRINEQPNKEFDWKELLVASGKGALVGGAGGYIIGSILDYQNSLEHPLNTDLLLVGIVNDIRLNKSDRQYPTLSSKADTLINILKRKYHNKLDGEPMKLGSTEKGTALRNKFDLDICLPFKPGSFSSTEEMYYSVLECLENHVGQNSVVNIRDQKKSVGVILEIRGDRYKIDVVPYKLTKGNSSSGYLYVNSKNIFVNNSSRTKTDIYRLKNIRLSETQKKIVTVLKHWKNKYDVPISSHLLENLVLDSYYYNRNNIPKSLTKKIMMVFYHIKDNFDTMVIRGIENTNNILTDLPLENKNLIISTCKRIIEEYEYQPNSIVDFLGEE
jgi:hypothetical protein